MSRIERTWEMSIGDSPRYCYDEKLYLRKQFLAIPVKERYKPEGFAGFPERPFEPVVVRVLQAADGSSTPHDRRWVKEWDPDTGLVTTTDRTEAKSFPHHGEAFRQWREKSAIQPTLPNGKPNRPLTAVSIEILKEP